MAGERNGPALDQGALVYQAAGATYTVPIKDPDGSRPNVIGATAAWWAGPVPAGRPQGPQFASVAGQPGAITKALQVVADPDGGFMVILDIAPEDVAGFAPTGLYQHEIWITEVGRRAYPITIGTLVIRGTVKGSAAA